MGTINKYGYTLACHFSELQAEKGIKVKVSRKTLALFLHNGQVFAMKDRCPHQNVPLHRKCIAHTSHTLSSDVNVNSCWSAGDIEDFHGEPCVKCPAHGLKFSLASGSCSVKRYTQKVYKTRVRNDQVWVKIWSSQEDCNKITFALIFFYHIRTFA